MKIGQLYSITCSNEPWRAYLCTFSCTVLEQYDATTIYSWYPSISFQKILRMKGIRSIINNAIKSFRLCNKGKFGTIFFSGRKPERTADIFNEKSIFWFFFVVVSTRCFCKHFLWFCYQKNVSGSLYYQKKCF